MSEKEAPVVLDTTHLEVDKRGGIKLVEGYVTLDSGKRESFDTGAVRDTQEGKMRWDLPPWEILERLVGVYTRGAAKYSDHNWKQGIPFSRFWASFMRHAVSVLKGVEDGEDHGAGCLWNMVGIMWTLQKVKEGKLPKELDDRSEVLG